MLIPTILSLAAVVVGITALKRRGTARRGGLNL
jgi:hypothetical protein